MATIPRSFVAGEKPTVAQWNAAGNAFFGMGVADDNAGKLIIPISLDLPFGVRSGGGTPQTKAIAGSTTYTVPSGKFFYVQVISASSTVIVQVTPSGGSAINVSLNTAIFLAHTGLCLGAGDSITVPANAVASGLLFDAAALVGSPARVLEKFNNTTTYTVPTGKHLLATHLMPCATQSLCQIDGVGAIYAYPFGGLSSAGQHQTTPRLYLAASQALSVSSANDWLVSGMAYSV